MSEKKRKERTKRPTGTLTTLVGNVDYQAYSITKIGLFLIGIVIFILGTFIVFFTDSEDPTLVNLSQKGIIGMLLALVGLFFMLIDVVLIASQSETIKFQVLKITREDIGFLVTIVFLGTATISFANFLVFNTINIPRFSITGLELFLSFAILMGIVEELFFTFFTQIFVVLMITRDKITPGARAAGLITRTAAFTYYHYSVYGTQIQNLIAVAIMGFVMGGIVELTRRIEGNIIVHALINLLSGSLGQGFTIQAT